MNHTIFPRSVLMILMMAVLCLAGVAQPAGAQPQKKSRTNASAPKVSSVPTSATEALVPLEIKLPHPRYGDFGDGGLLYYNLGEGLENLYYKFYAPRPPFMVPRGVRLISLKKKVTASSEPLLGELDQVTDGEIDYGDGAYVELGLMGIPDVQWVQIDLDEPCDVYAIVIWHYFDSKPRVYRDVIVRCADDLDFKRGVKTLFNNDSDNSAKLGIGGDREYVDTYQGKLIDCKDKQGQPTRTRNIRCYSNGNNSNDVNHYVEVEVYGRPCVKAK